MQAPHGKHGFTKLPVSRLGLEIAGILLLKLILLIVLWRTFIAPNQVKVDADTAAASLLSITQAAVPGEKTDAR